MSSLWASVLGTITGLVLVWVLLAVVLVVSARRYERPALREILRLLPDTLRMLHRLARDPQAPRGVRRRLWLLLAYLALPIDLVPDFLPVIGYVDDAIIVALTLRSVVRLAGPDALARQWPGSADGLAVILRASRVQVTHGG